MIGKIVSTRIREIREALELTQEELASRSGLTERMVGAIERRERVPSLEVLASIANGLGVPVTALVETPPSGDRRARVYKRVNKVLGTLTPGDLRIAVRLLEVFAAEVAKRRR